MADAQRTKSTSTCCNRWKKVEQLALASVDECRVDEWFEGAGQFVKQVADGVDGLSMELIAKNIGFMDVAVVTNFRDGAACQHTRAHSCLRLVRLPRASGPELAHSKCD